MTGSTIRPGASSVYIFIMEEVDPPARGWDARAEAGEFAAEEPPPRFRLNNCVISDSE